MCQNQLYQAFQNNQLPCLPGKCGKEGLTSHFTHQHSNLEVLVLKELTEMGGPYELYRRAFDLIGHSILVRKLCALKLPICITNWIIDFLSDRFQRIKPSHGCVFEWNAVSSGFPQGTKLGLWLFLIKI